MKQLLDDRKEKQVILDKVKKTAAIKSEQIAGLEKQIESYDLKQQSISKKNKSLAQVVAGLEKELQAQKALHKKQSAKLNQNIDQLKESLAESKTQAQSSKKTFEQRRQKQLTQINSLFTELQNARKEYKQTKNEMAKISQQASSLSKSLKQTQSVLAQVQQNYQSTKSELSGKNAQVDSMQSKIDTLTKSGERLKSSLAQLKGLYQGAKENLASTEQSLASLKGKNSSLGKALKDLQGKYDSLGSKFAKTQGELSGLKGKHSELGAKLANSQGQYEGAMASANKCEQDKNLAYKKIKDLRSARKNAARKLASVKEKIRTDIAKNLASRFEQANIPVVVDRLTGNIVFQMDDLFLFKNNSAELSEQMKVKLQRIIPIYADELLGKKDIAQHILRINIEGHASPTFKRQFVDPDQASAKAYNYNLSLSGKRASQLVEYIFGESFTPFAYQNHMRKITNFVGYSFSRPIKSEKVSLACGIYDCKKSRRVVISFTLNNNELILDAFEKTKSISLNK
jgi:chromosome segregation ATPase